MKKILALLLAAVMVLSMVACAGPAEDTTPAGSSNGTTTVTDINLKVWSPTEDQGENKDGWLYVMLEKFEKAHPEYNITWDIGVCGEGDAGNTVKADPSAAADVYMFANDQIGTLLQSNALSKLGGSYKEQVLNDNAETQIASVTYSDGEIYGFPMTNNTWFLYYNKSIYTEEDIKSLDTMVSKGKVAFQMGTGWYNGAFFFGNGCTLFGEDGLDAAAGAGFGGDAGYAAAKKMVELFNTGNFVDDTNGSGVSGMKTGDIAACFSGSWDYAGLHEALGENLGAAQLPTYTIDGKEYQLKSFAGTKCVGVNPNTKQPKAAMQLAAFLASEDAQMERYTMRNVIPCHKNLAASEAISSNMIAVAEQNTMKNTSVVQSSLPEMGVYWTPMGTFGGSIVTKETNLDNYQDQVDLLVGSLNGTGL